MQWLTRGVTFGLGVVATLFVTGCDVEGQVMNTIGAALDIVGIWVD